MKRISLLAVAAAVFAAGCDHPTAPKVAVITSPTDGATSYSGHATVLSGTVAGINIGPFGATTPVGPSGGAEEASGPSVTVPDPTTSQTLLAAQTLHATTVAQGNHSRSEASVANVALNAGDYHITAGFLMARAEATCNNGTASVSASSEIATLHVRNDALGINEDVAVTGQPNQPLTVGAVNGLGGVQIGVINEQPPHGSNDITVRALHITIPGVADVVIAEAHADITCGATTRESGDFVTGGGWITGTPSASKGHFAVAGGLKNGVDWGHLHYIDQGAGWKVKGLDAPRTTSTGCAFTLVGTAEVTHPDQSGVTVVEPLPYTVHVTDGGEPGRLKDYFDITVGAYSATGPLQGGNIQAHKVLCPPTA
jgi:hypothetical protein